MCYIFYKVIGRFMVLIKVVMILIRIPLHSFMGETLITDLS